MPAVSDINSLNPNIGARVFVVVPAKGIIVPAIVIEKVISETPEGITSTYMLDFGEKDRARVPSNAVANSIIVKSEDDAYEAIIEHAKKKAMHAVQAAQTIALKRFGPLPDEPEENDQQEDVTSFSILEPV